MLTLFLRCTDLYNDRRAVTALEYGLIAAVVVAIGLAGFSVIGDTMAEKVNTLETVFN